MGYILLGHGDLDIDPTATPPEMDIVAIPLGTTIQFFADAGQNLCYGSQCLDAWDQLKPPWPPLDSRHVTYNFSLSSAWEHWEEELANDPHFGGHQLIRPGIGDIPDPVRLCTGTPATCPTSALRVREGDTHHCDGILGRPEFQGEDLFWLACSPIDVTARSVIDAARNGSPSAVHLGDDPDQAVLWDASAQPDVDAVNVTWLEGAPDGQVLRYALGGGVLLIGGGHVREAWRYVVVQDDLTEGRLVALRGADGASAGITVVGMDVPPGLHESLARSLVRLAPVTAVRFAWDDSSSSAEYSGYSDETSSWISHDGSDGEEEEESEDDGHMSLRTVAECNRLTVRTCTGQTVDYCGGGGAFLIGTDRGGHEQRYVDFVRAQQDCFEGRLTILGDCELRIADVPPHRRVFVEEALLDQFVGVQVQFR
ncbi:hypothetical protein [Streptomyces sp. NPDC001594]|uniref:hypothetical protein n=1 Tax=Streptomyces sp. NPDC001594 TaxID=3364590 RepID=UPI00369BFB04